MGPKSCKLLDSLQGEHWTESLCRGDNDVGDELGDIVVLLGRESPRTSDVLCVDGQHAFGVARSLRCS